MMSSEYHWIPFRRRTVLSMNSRGPFSGSFVKLSSFQLLSSGNWGARSWERVTSNFCKSPRLEPKAQSLICNSKTSLRHAKKSCALQPQGRSEPCLPRWQNKHWITISKQCLGSENEHSKFGVLVSVVTLSSRSCAQRPSSAALFRSSFASCLPEHAWAAPQADMRHIPLPCFCSFGSFVLSLLDSGGPIPWKQKSLRSQESDKHLATSSGCRISLPCTSSRIGASRGAPDQSV